MSFRLKISLSRRSEPGVIHKVILQREQVPPGSQEHLGHAVPFDRQ